MSWGVFTILVCLAALATLLVGGWVFDYHDPNTDAAGRGLAGAYIAVVDVVAFLAIGALLVMCGSRGAFSTPWGVLAVVTFLCAAAAHVAVLSVIDNLSPDDHFDLTLRVLFPIAPALTIVFLTISFYNKAPSTAGRLGAAVPALIAALSILTVVGPARSAGRNRNRIVQEAYNAQVETDRKRADEVIALPLDTPLEQLLPYLEAPLDFDSQAVREAIKRIQQLPSRQTQAIALLEESVRLYPDAYPKKFFIDELLRQQGRPRE
jgi:hypothetical protein